MSENAYSLANDDGSLCDMGGNQDALVEELYRVEGKAEIVNGRLVRMSAAGGLHGYAAGVVFSSLFEYARQTKQGAALPDNVGFIVKLPRRRSFSPDAAFWTGARLTRKFPKAPRFLLSKCAVRKTTAPTPSTGWPKSVPTMRAYVRTRPFSSTITRLASWSTSPRSWLT